MTLWDRILHAVQAVAGGGLLHVFERLRTPPERSVGFTIAVIALSAKMAKADGLVTRDEVSAFREVFFIAPQDEAGAARVFNLARQDVAGFEEYARRIRRMFEEDSETLLTVLEGLYHIALADGRFHPLEDAFLNRVAEIFGISAPHLDALRSRFVPDAARDPYVILGVTPDMDLAEIRKVWRGKVRETHPDVMIARGVPEEAVRIAERRLVDINRAWEQIASQRAAG